MPFAPGDILYAEDIDRMGVSLRRVAAQNLPVSAFTAVSWDTEDADTSAMFAPPGTSITIPTGGGGIWAITTWVGAAVAPSGLAFISLQSGALEARVPFADDKCSASAVWPLSAGAAIVTNVYRTGAAATTMTGNFYAYRVSA